MNSIRRIAASFFCAALLLPAIHAQSVQENKKARLQKEIADIERLLSANENKSRSALDSYSLIQKKVKARKELVAESDRKISAMQKDISSKQLQIDRMQSRVDTLTYYYGRLVKSVYKNRDTKSWYMYIIASDSFGQAYRRFNYFKSLSDTMQEQARHLKQAKAELEEEKKALLSMSDEMKSARADQVKDLQSLQKEENESSALVARLKKDRKRYTNEIAAKRKQIDALDREIRNSISRAMKPGSGKVKIDYTLAKEFAKNKGILPWPVEGLVVETYGQHYHPVFTTVKLPFNKGINIETSHDAPVHSVFDGTVNRIVVLPNYNVCVLVQHGNYFSFYCKLKTAGVKVGDKVKTGDVIGSVDTINGSTQLHFEIWEEQQHKDPQSWLRPM